MITEAPRPRRRADMVDTADMADAAYMTDKAQSKVEKPETKKTEAEKAWTK
jgi:hypothetical protein